MQIVTAKEMYDIDRFTMDEIGLSGELLMENAGQAFVQKAVRFLDKRQKIAVLIGTGNNGGDGFVIARILKNLGYVTDALLIVDKEKVKGDALFHYRIFQKCGYEVIPFTDVDCLRNYDVLIDAMLGIGIKGDLRSPYREIIEASNALSCLKISVDIPSGVSADSSPSPKLAFKADYTITLQHPKLSAFSYPARTYYGKLEVVSIGIPPKATETVLKVQRKCWTENDVQKTLPKRSPSSHKSMHGKGLVIGGSISMIGAPLMSTRAAIRAGAGLTTLAIPDAIYPIVASQMVEAMFSPWKTENGHFSGEIGTDVSKFDAVAFGPGVGRENGGEKILSTLLTDLEAPLIVDADGLYYLAGLKQQLKKRKYPTILTPHAGEFARLTGYSLEKINENRFEISKQFARKYGVYIVLKGPFSIVTTPTGSQFVNTSGNAALAKGGTGDVLTGILLAFVMNQANVQEAISNAVFVHGKAADVLIKEAHSMQDVIATDVIEVLPSVFRTFLHTDEHI